MAKGATKGTYARWQYAQDARRLAEIEASIAQQLALIKNRTTPARDTTQANDLLRTLCQARDTLIEQHQFNRFRTAPDDTPSATAAAPDGQGRG
jgi:hypothetical protein